MASPQMQGFLKKKGKKRYFILYNNIIYWFKNEQKSVTFNHSEIKGCLELKGCSAMLNKDKPINSFVISNLKDMNYYVLTAATKEQCDAWLDAVKKSIEAAKTVVAEVEEKRGVLTKKGKERLFVLKGDSLIWFLSKTGVEKKAKGSLPLTKAQVQRGSKTSSFVISPKTGKPYELIAKSVAECDEWLAAVKKVIDRLADIEGEEHMDEKSGYLMKKGQKRWFIIKNGKLLWFNKLQSDVSQTANNYALLTSSTISTMPSASGKYPFRLVTKKGNDSKEYVLTASSERECSDWIEALIVAGATPGEASTNIRGSKGLTPQPQQPQQGATAETNGEGENHVRVSVPPRPSGRPGINKSQENVNSNLQPRDNNNNHNTPGFNLAASAPVSSMLGELSGGGGGGALAGNRGSAGAAGGSAVVGQTSTTQSRGSPPLGAGGAGRGELNRTLSGKINNQKINPGGSGVGAGGGVAGDNLSAFNKALPDKKSGWLQKKGKKRWFVLENGALNWYSQPKKHESGATPNGYLVIADCNVSSIGQLHEGYAFAIYSRKEKGNEYILMASSAYEMEDWVLILLKGGAIVEKERKGTVVGGAAPGDMEDEAPMQAGGYAGGTLRSKDDRNGWLEKKGKKRWFVLKNGRLSWYKAIPEGEDASKEPAGYLELKECQVRRIDGKKIKGKYALLLFTENGEKKREYMLLHSNEVEVNEWVEALVGRGGARRDISVPKTPGTVSTYVAPGSQAKGKVFGASLEEILKREGRLDSGVPEIVEKCVAYIRQYGLEVEGIFRVSGDTGVVSQLRELIEKAADNSSAGNPFNVKEDFEFDIHTISGILKSFLREMDPPLLTWELYRDFVEAAGRELTYLSELIGKLPPLHQSLLRYLMFFLNEVASHSDKSKMAPMNLSIVFAPNMFRSKGDPLEVLANSAQTATVCQSMIVNCKKLWPESSNVVEQKQIVVDNNNSEGGGGGGGPDPTKRYSTAGRGQAMVPPGVRLQDISPKNLKPVGGVGGPTSPPAGGGRGQHGAPPPQHAPPAAPPRAGRPPSGNHTQGQTVTQTPKPQENPAPPLSPRQQPQPPQQPQQPTPEVPTTPPVDDTTAPTTPTPTTTPTPSTTPDNSAAEGVPGQRASVKWGTSRGSAPRTSLIGNRNK